MSLEMETLGAAKSWAKKKIDEAVSGLYRPAGSKTVSELTQSLLIRDNVGNVYNAADSGTTTSDFVEGAGNPINAGDNILVADVGTASNPVYKFDILAGAVDLSDCILKSDTVGLVKNDGTIDTTQYADKAEMSITDGTGADVGTSTIQLKTGTSKKVLTAHQDISGKAEKSEMSVTDGTGADADKTTIQLKQGTSATVLKSHQDISGKANRVSGAVTGNFASLDANGNPADSGKKASDFVEAVEGKELSTNDYTNEEKTKLAELSNYDDTALSGRVTAIETVVPSAATEQNKLSTAADVAGENISAISTASLITDSADARVQGLTIKGRSHRSKNLFNINGNVNMIGARHLGGDEGWIEIDDNTRSTVSGNVLTANRNESTSWGAGQIINVKPNTNYTISAKVLSFGTGNKAVLSLETQTQKLAGRLFFSELNERLSRTYNSGNNSELLFAFYSKDGTGAQFTDIQIEESAAVTDYEPYGIHSVGDAGWGVKDLGTLTWGYDSINNDFFTDIQNYFDITVGLCSKYNFVVLPSGTPPSVGLQNGEITSFNSRLYVRDLSIDAASFKTAVTGVLLYYPLADATGATPTLGITLKNGTGQGTAATIITGLPLRSVSDGIYDTLDNTQAVTRVNGGKINDTNIFNWEFYSELSNDTRSVFSAQIQNCIYPDRYTLPSFLVTGFGIQTQDETWTVGNVSCQSSGNIILTVEPNITTTEALLTAYGNEEIYYPLATPTTTPLTAAEISAFRQLRTFDSTTNINITDEPEFEIDYLRNTENGETVSRVVDDLQGQINTKYQLSEGEIIAQIADRIYQGTDLTVKFALEIATYNNDPWAWIKARITAGNFTGIHVGDYIPFTTTNNITFNAQIAGINTYKGYGDNAVGPHIDFICKELWPTPHPINKVDYNNGTAAQRRPWLASDLYLYINSLAGTVPSEAVVGGGEGTVVDYTTGGVYYYLPTQLKNVIIEKRFLSPTRYSVSGLLSDDNSWEYANIGKLWLPNECEVYGMPVWGGKGGYSLGGSSLQYPLFAGNMNRQRFREGGRDHWWLLSPCSGNSTYWCRVGGSGDCVSINASNSGSAAPVCFRIA